MKKMIFNLSLMIVMVSCNTQNAKETTSDSIAADSTMAVSADSTTATLNIQNDSLPEREEEEKDEQEKKED